MANILVIDDEEWIREELVEVLEMRDHTVTEASDGVEGLERFVDGSFDLVVTDIIMPNKGGIETIAELRNLAPNVKIVAMSGGGRVESRDFLAVAERFGTLATMAKPFALDEFIAVVEGALSRR